VTGHRQRHPAGGDDLGSSPYPKSVNAFHLNSIGNRIKYIDFIDLLDQKTR